MAGVPFDTLEGLSTCATAGIARQVIVERHNFEAARLRAAQILAQRENGLSADEFRSLRAAIRTGRLPETVSEKPSLEFVSYARAANSLRAIEERLSARMEKELSASRSRLREAAQLTVPPFLVFGAMGANQLLDEFFGSDESPSPRNKRARERERHLLLYLQRIAAKNDTFSEFGPTGWGRIVSGVSGLQLVPSPGIARRETYFERWVSHAIANSMNQDPDVRAEISPRLNPSGWIDGSTFRFATTNERVELNPISLRILARCDGRTPAHSLGYFDTLQILAAQNVIWWKVEVPALDPKAFRTIEDDVRHWRNCPTRDRWLSLIEPLKGLPDRLKNAELTAARKQVLITTADQVRALGEVRGRGRQFLYSALNPIGEDCYRDCGFKVGPEMMDEVVTEAAPWIDLWRDCYAYVASRVAGGLSDLLRSAPSQNGTVLLPGFLAHCEAQKMSLTGNGLVALAHMAFREILAAFQKLFADRQGEMSLQLGADECHFVRRLFEFPKFDEYTYPSADLQIAAKSIDAVGHGEFTWVVSELHPPIALLHHGGYWSCPDFPALGQALARTACGRPNFYYGFFAADFTAHTTVRQMDAIPELTNFVAPLRGRPEWRMIPPAETEVYIDENSGDVCLRRRGTNEYLGSFARYWIIPLGFHPFNFSLGRHTPRLRCGKVIVQRRAWTVTSEEMGAGNFTGVSRDLVIAVERLRAARDLPRYVYIRPTEQALRRSGAEGRDKDTKPVFIDLESYLFLEIFHRWLTKAGEIEVTEMLPDPDHLPWKEADGRRTFELRTLIVPRE